MREDTSATLNRLIDPLVPVGPSGFRDVLDSMELDINEQFIVDVLTQENMVPVTGHPLHQKKALGLAEEFRTVGFPGVARFLTDHVLRVPNLSDSLREKALRLAGNQAKR